MYCRMSVYYIPASSHLSPTYPIIQIQVSLATQAPCTHGGSQTTINKNINKIIGSNYPWNIIPVYYDMLYNELKFIHRSTVL